MANDVDAEETVSSYSDRFPFVMVLTTTFLLGGMFLVLNAPLIAIACGAFNPIKCGETICEITGLATLLSCGIAPFWTKAVGMGQGIASSFLFLMLSLLVGLLLTPFDRLSPMIFGYLWSRGRRLLRRTTAPAPIEPFSSRMFVTTDNAAFLAALMTNRVAKLHWEWELFNHYAFWSTFDNILLFILLALYIQLPHLSVMEGIFYAALFLSFFGYAALRSEVMARVHAHYHQAYLGGSLGAKRHGPRKAPAAE